MKKFFKKLFKSFMDGSAQGAPKEAYYAPIFEFFLNHHNIYLHPNEIEEVMEMVNETILPEGGTTVKLDTGDHFHFYTFRDYFFEHHDLTLSYAQIKIIVDTVSQFISANNYKPEVAL